MKIAIIGAGLAGLSCGRVLQQAGHEVTLFDKGRSPGGRLATRRIGDAVLDHGAQFFTVRGSELRAQTDDWIARGIVKVWCHGFGSEADGYPRFVGVAGMNSLAKDLAAGLDVRCDHLAFSVRRGSHSVWEVVIDDGGTNAADVVVLTPPMAQSFSLVFEAGVDLPVDVVRSEYNRCIALLAVLDGPSAVPAPGGVQLSAADDPVFSFIGDNFAKGVSPVPAVTFHGSPDWSAAHWDDDRPEVTASLLAAARPWLGGATVVDHHVKRWRFAGPGAVIDDRFWRSPEGDLVVCGDAFAGSKFEGAFNSGRAAAESILADRR